MPGISGSKSLRYFGCPVRARAPVERPWKELSSDRISCFCGPVLLPWEWIILIAPSIDSVPELVKKTRWSPLVSHSFFASGPW